VKMLCCFFRRALRPGALGKNCQGNRISNQISRDSGDTRKRLLGEKSMSGPELQEEGLPRAKDFKGNRIN
jgi:hypothetical protein